MSEVGLTRDKRSLFRGMSVEDRIKAQIEVDESGCWLWLIPASHGYGQIQVNGKNVRAHRASYEAFVGIIPEGMFVLHRCDRPACVNPGHLFLGDAKANAVDAVAKGRNTRLNGSRNGQARLTEAEVMAMRRDPRPQRQVALDYGVDPSTVSLIRTRRKWAHVQ